MDENKDKSGTSDLSTPAPKSGASNLRRDNLPKKGAGRPPKQDWKRLFDEWAVSGRPRNEWLLERNLDPRAGNVREKVKNWEAVLNAKAVGMRETAIAQDVVKAMQEPVSNVIPMPERVSEIPIGRDAVEIPHASEPSAWQIINQWRRKQAVDDWKSADSIRSAVKLILRDAIKESNENGKRSYKTTLKPHEIRQLMQSLADCQRVQRLALGLSTENVGLDQIQAHDANIEKPAVDQDSEVPTFEVLMSSRGRFLRPRPRRTN